MNRTPEGEANRIELKELRLRSKYINETHHPEFPLIIWNYTKECQWEKKWDEYTMQCRGLITTEDGEIVARSFKKFFNLNETDDTNIAALPAVQPIISKKYDGSLGISYFFEGVPYIATRGSFKSEQSEWANSAKGRLWNPAMLRGEYTYLFELCYPENRIVVDYRGREFIVLLAVIHTSTGAELRGAELKNEADRIGVVPAEDFNYTIEEALEELKSLNGTDGEGFVLQYPNALSFTFKSEDYKRLHFLLTNFSTRSIWWCLRDGTGIEEALKAVPDEFYDWVLDQKQKLETKYKEIYDHTEEIANEARRLETRKEQAEYIIKNAGRYSGICFSILDEKRNTSDIWTFVRPAYERPFSSKGQEES